MPSLHLSPSCSVCHNFFPEPGSPLPERAMSVWLAPVAVSEKGDRHQIVWRCSLGDRCYCACVYARGERKVTNE
ncbi:hypothetical protein ES708_02279 [subsurface metagenome]